MRSHIDEVSVGGLPGKLEIPKLTGGLRLIATLMLVVFWKPVSPVASKHFASASKDW